MIERQVPALQARIDECDADFEALREWRESHADDPDDTEDGP